MATPTTPTPAPTTTGPVYWAWGDSSKRKTNAEKIKEGAAVYAERFGHPPTVVGVHPDQHQSCIGGAVMAMPLPWANLYTFYFAG